VRAQLALLAAASIWGLSYLATKVALRDLGPFELATVRVLIAAALFLPAFVAGRARLARWDGPILGLLGVVIYYGAFNVGLREARATDAGVIQASIPAVSALLAVPLLGERASWRVWLGIALSSVGVVVLVLGTGVAGQGSLVGDLWIVASVVTWALYTIYLRQLAPRARDAVVTAATLVWGGALLVPLGLGELAIVRPTLSLEGVAAIIYLAVFAGALGYWLWSYGLARIETGRASVYLNLLPLVAAVSGVVFLGERLGVSEFAGGVLIVGGVLMTTRGA
jgi:drug/metabolite transporter (DMT)-like permease